MTQFPLTIFNYEVVVQFSYCKIININIKSIIVMIVSLADHLPPVSSGHVKSAHGSHVFVGNSAFNHDPFRLRSTTNSSNNVIVIFF